MGRTNYFYTLKNIFFKNSVFDRKMKNNKSVFSNVKYVFSIGDIHGDFQTFKDTIMEIGCNKYISVNGNIFSTYKKNIFGIEFELCKINKENILNDNFIIVQLGDLFYSAYKYNPTNNEEIRLIFFIFSLIDSFNELLKYRKRCKYIQILGNHDILILTSSRENVLFQHLDDMFNNNEMLKDLEVEDIEEFINFDYYNKNRSNYEKVQQISNFIKTYLLNIGIIFCKVNNVLYTHCFFNSISLNYLFGLVLNNKFYNMLIKRCSYFNRDTLLYYFYNLIFKDLIINFYYPQNLTIEDIHKEITKNFKYIANDLVKNTGNKFLILNDLHYYFNCDKIIMGHIINVENLDNETNYFNGLIKCLDIGISKKSICKFNITRDFKLFYCCQIFKFYKFQTYNSYKEYFYSFKM